MIADEMREEKEFLEDYVEFAVDARLLAARLFADQYKSTSDKTTRQLLHVLAMEQFFMMMETFIGFFKAIQKRSEKPILDTLQKDASLTNFFSEVQKPTKEALLRTLGIKLDDFSTDERRQIMEWFAKVCELLQSEDWGEAVKLAMSVFPKIKHKFLIYRADNKLKIVIPNEQEKRMQQYKEQNPEVFEEPEQLPEDIDWIIVLIERLKFAVQGLTAIRLLEIQHR